MSTLLHRIALVGAGNLAWHLGQQMTRCGLDVVAVWSRQQARANALADVLHTQGVDQLTALPTDADAYIIAVADQGIAAVAEELAAHLPSDALLLHTSGATATDALSAYFVRSGVFYPLQTFSRGRAVDFFSIPLCVHTHRQEDGASVQQLACRLSREVHAVDDAQRMRLHLAAVFVNNFTNYLQHIARTLADEHGLASTMLQPLLRETVAKLDVLTPAQAQTGPAIRQDTATIERHLALLSEHPDWQQLYKQLTAAIQTIDKKGA